MRVLVTGASGFVGRWVVSALRLRGHDVIAVSRNGQPVDVSGCDGVQWRTANLLQRSDIDSLIQKESPAGLIHCAWDTTPGTYWTASANLNWVASSLQLLEAFVQNGGQRAMVAGTSAEYCWKNSGSLNESDSVIAPNTLYGVSKNALRQILEQWAETNTLSLAWGRVFCPFGPLEKSDRLIPRLIQQLSCGQEFPFDSGDLIRDFLSVEDLGDAFASVFDSDFEGAINLASGTDLSIRDLVTLIADHFGTQDTLRFGVSPDPVGQPMRIVADISRLKNEVCWTPGRSMPDRIRETCDWWLTRQTSGNQPKK